MTFFRKLITLFILSLILIQCKYDPKETQTEIPGPPVDSIQISKPQSQYLHLTGTVKDIPVTMNLIKGLTPITSGAEPDFEYSGSYYYNEYMEPISINQLSDDSTDLIRLSEWSSDDVTNQFVGEFLTPTRFKGEWVNGYRGFSLSADLNEHYPRGTVELDFYSEEVFEPANKTKPKKEGISFGLSSLWPKDNNAFLKSEIIRMIYGDEANPTAKNPVEIFKDLKSGYIEDYHLMVKDFAADSIPPENYAYDFDMGVIWNEDSLLVLEYAFYSYEGGAHGNFGKDHYNLDLRTKRRLELSDVFLVDFDKKIAKSLEKALRRKYELRPKDDIREIVDVDRIPVTDNFYLTGGGIGFYYPPYELGPWAAGDFEFFVRYEDIEDLLKPEFLDRF